jgi:hypothetical protein
MEANLRLGSWAGTGSREIQVIGDGNGAREFSSAPRTIGSEGTFRISMKPFGGFVGTVR